MIANGQGMTERNVAVMRDSQRQFDDHVRTVAASSGPAGEIEKAKQLLDSGAISQDEFNQLKAKALG
jgi:hypothetical protein